jgi:glycosyltransferase involved in cell wall biosynthesis
MDLSVIICTYNRCDSLALTLETFRHLKIPQEVTWEVIVVDNNSTDSTKSVCKQFESSLPLRYLFEGRQGKSNALETGIASAKSDLLVFTDDDVDVAPDWLAQVWQASLRHAKAVIFGGKVVPRWERPAPKWIVEGNPTTLRGVIVSHDRGDDDWQSSDSQERLTELKKYPFIGANLAFRRRAIEQSGVKFHKDLGPRANEEVRGEETLLQQELLSKGYTAVYAAAALVYHRNPVSRMTRSYMRKWYEGEGRAAVRLGDEPALKPMWFGAPRYLWRQWALCALNFVIARMFQPIRVWLDVECRKASKWGAIREFRDRAKGR